MPTTPQAHRHWATPTRISLAALLAVCAATPVLAGPAYSSPQVFARPGWASTQLWDINSQGHMVGQSYNDVSAEGFVYANGVFTAIAPPGAPGGAITGISDTGVLVGTYFSGDPDSPISSSFIYDAGAYSDFTLPGATAVTLRRISANSRFLTGTFDDAGGSFRAFAFDRQTASVVTLPLAGNTAAIMQGVTSQGLAVGSTFGQNAYSFTFDVSSGVLTPYTGTDLGVRPRFRDINDSGVITGFSGTQAFVGTPGNWTFFDPAPGISSALGYGLNNQGDLIGYYSGDNGELQSFTASPVPEPAAWALLAGGLALLALLAWRRRPA